MKKRYGNISNKILIPLVLFVLLGGLGLYAFVLRSVSDFADNFILDELMELRRDIYNICDEKYDALILSGSIDNDRFILIQKARAIRALEDYARNKNVHVHLFEEERPVLLDESLTGKGKDIHAAYSAEVYFEPWSWKINLYKDKESFAYLKNEVNRIYGITALFLVFAGMGLYLYLNRIIVDPMERITDDLKRGVLPSYKGILEYQFLSDNIREMMLQIQREAEVRISEEKLRTIIETVPVGIAISTMDGQLIEANTAFARMFGYESKEEFLQKPVIDFYQNPDDRAIFLKMIGQGMVREFEFQAVRRDGTLFWVSISSIPRDGDAEAQIINSIIDISFRKHAEEELVKRHDQLLSLSRHLESIREEERKSIAREIHDELGQELTALNMYISWMADHLPDDREDLLYKTGEMSALANRTIRAVQRVVSQLRPGLLDTIGLKAAIESDIDKFLKNSNIEIESRFDLDDGALDPNRSVSLYRIWQEALTNIIRHSKATHASVTLGKRNGNIIMEVKDNGIGISEERVFDPMSFGIMGMRERAYMMKGSFLVGKNENGGTQLRVEVTA